MFEAKMYASMGSARESSQRGDPHNVAVNEQRYIIEHILALVQERLAKNIEPYHQGMRNVPVGNSGLAYNCKSKTEGVIVGMS